ncbi:sigma-70 family RNA polymerase sigma factor [Bradyrhizobium sp. SYSU BS000235]|uniref:sigma-70 family RNA polymerase sigma factor n=1 Tax=Bradyrhizobium sp. SYSU BS000235 TaxID=3411332 RepID=UPI003C7166EA
MMQQVYITSASRVIDCRTQRSFADMMIKYLAEKISSVWDVGLASIMAGRRRVPALVAASMTSAASQLDDVARTRPANATNTHARFHRDIVPQLDAAYNFARFLSRDADAAQDIVQEAFLRAYRSFEGYQGGDARAWIFAIVRNCYHNWLLERRRKMRVEADAPSNGTKDDPAYDVASDDDDPEMSLLRRTESDAVRLVLGKLPRALREMLVLRELEGLSYRQISEIAEVPIGTVMSRLARARTQFQTAWRHEINDHELSAREAM